MNQRRIITPISSIALSDVMAISLIAGGVFLATLTYFLYLFDGFVLGVTPVGIGSMAFSIFFGVRFFTRSQRIMAMIQNRPIRRSTVAIRLVLSPLYAMAGFTGGCVYVAYLLRARGYVSTASVESWAIAFLMSSVAGIVMFVLVERDILGRLTRAQARLAMEAKP